MSGISRETLFGKLNPIAYQSVESATVFCKMRGNPYVELVHWLAQLVQTAGTDVESIIRHYELEASTLARDLAVLLGTAKKQNEVPAPSFKYEITEMHLFDLFPQTFHIETLVRLRRVP